jgi:hypothetical protein
MTDVGMLTDCCSPPSIGCSLYSDGSMVWITCLNCAI